MDNMVDNKNLALCFVRRSRTNNTNNFLIARDLIDKSILSSADNANVAPLYLYPSQDSGDMFEAQRAKEAESDPNQGRQPNISEEFIEDCSKKLGLKFIQNGSGDLKKTFGPEDVFFYIYGIFHSPVYRTRYEEFLKRDFPRVPLTANKKLFRELRRLGEEVGRLHLMDAHGPEIVSFPVSGSNEVDKVRYTEPKGETPGRVWINPVQYFEGVPPEVWRFFVGGYQVCEKWLKDRKGRTLSYDDLEHYKHIVSALNETIRIMGEIDDAIDQHGAWPIQ